MRKYIHTPAKFKPDSAMSVIDSEEEAILLSHIVDGLGAAIKSENVALGANSSSEFRKVRDIRVNKLVLEAVDETDLPIFWSWFMYGRSLANSAALGKEVNWESLDDDEATETATDIHRNVKSRQWYRDFFIQDVEIGDETGVADICTLNIDEFLRAAYEEAPEEHKSLYMANLEMQTILREVAYEETWYSQSSNEEFYQDLREAVRTLQDELILHQEMPTEDAQLVSEYLRLVKRAVAGVQATPTEELTNPHETLSTLVQKYHKPVWRLPALRISSLTVHGRGRKYKRSEFTEEADSEQQDRVREELVQIRHNLKKADFFQSRTEWTLSNESLREQTERTETALLD